MSDYTRSRSRESPMSEWMLWVIGVAVVLMLCGVGINLVSAWRRGGVEKSITAVEVSRVEALDKIDPAEQEVRENGGKFAPHWSAAFPDQLKQARQNLIDNGQVAALLNQARAELKADHLDKAKSLASQGDAVVIASLDVVNKILGPPSFYAELQRKSDEVDRGFLETVKAEIVRQRSYVDGLERKSLCGSSQRLSYKSAYGDLATAESQMGKANSLNTVLVDGVIDKPIVYDQAKMAFETVATAVAEANKSLADLAAVESVIANSQLMIDGSSAYILTSSHETLAATTALDGARSTLTLAKQACFNENFVEAISLANQAQSQAINARNIATPPTPVPVVIIVQDGGNSGGGSSSWDSGGSGSSDSGSSGGSDWGSGSSDSGSWDSGSSDSGSWDSGSSSDWGGSDSGSWDSGSSSDWGGSDSGSWDSGGDW